MGNIGAQPPYPYLDYDAAEPFQDWWSQPDLQGNQLAAYRTRLEDSAVYLATINGGEDTDLLLALFKDEQDREDDSSQDPFLLHLDMNMGKPLLEALESMQSLSQSQPEALEQGSDAPSASGEVEGFMVIHENPEQILKGLGDS